MYLRTEFGILRVFVRVDRVWDPVSVRTCGQTLDSCKCVFMWKEFGIVSVCVNVRIEFGILWVCVDVDRVRDRESVCGCGQSLGSCEYV